MSEDFQTCYFCDAPGITKEHVPPKCIFPELKDTNGVDLKRNLITVPSCVTHNTRKSGDDEFLMVSLAGILGNNSIGYTHHLRKVTRAIKRSSLKLLHEAYQVEYRRSFDLGNNRFIDLIWGKPDADRLIESFKRISYALFLHSHKVKFSGKVDVLLGHLTYTDKNSQTFTQFIKEKAASDLKDSDRLGENQAVFYFQWSLPDQFGLRLLKLCFYENIEIFASFAPANAKIPENLTALLIQKGVKTILKPGDKEYEFN